VAESGDRSLEPGQTQTTGPAPATGARSAHPPPSHRRTRPPPVEFAHRPPHCEPGGGGVAV